MSTRATYRFQDEFRDVTFYIHCDGYPEGAADYFRAMLDREGQMQSYNHGLAEVFFRANETAEITSGHEAHGDTEYRYDVGGPDATYQMRDGIRFNDAIRRLRAYDTDDEKPFFDGTVDDFVAQYSEKRAHA